MAPHIYCKAGVKSAKGGGEGLGGVGGGSKQKGGGADAKLHADSRSGNLSKPVMVMTPMDQHGVPGVWGGGGAIVGVKSGITCLTQAFDSAGSSGPGFADFKCFNLYANCEGHDVDQTAGAGGGGGFNLYANSEGHDVDQTRDSTSSNSPWHRTASNSISRLGFFYEMCHRVIAHQRPAGCS